MRVALAILCVALAAALETAAAADDDLLAAAAREDAAVERVVHEVLADALAGDRTVAADAVRRTVALDAERRAAGLGPSGLLDDVRWLAAAVEPTRTMRREALEALLDDGTDPEVERLARHALDSDDGARAERLLADDAHNRRASLVNDAIRPFGVFTGGALLAAINPILLAGSAVDSVATTAVNLWRWNDLSVPEREALVRYRGYLLREPDGDDVPAASQALRRLGRKRARAICRHAVEAGEEALDDGELDRAAFWLRHAHTLDDCADEARKPLDRLVRATAAHAAAEEAGRWAANDPVRPASDAEAAAQRDLLSALATGDASTTMTAAQRILAAHPDSPLVPGARLSVAVARDLAGKHDEARLALDDAADDDTGPGRLAAAVRDDPRYDAMNGLDAAERAHTADVVRYVVLGGVSGRSTLYGAAQLGAQGAQAAQSLGIFNVIGMATRGWRAWRQDPASNDEIIQRGEALLARDGSTPDAAEVHRRLADAYERAGNLERAIMHLRALPAPDGKRLADLEGRLATKLVADAAGSPAERLLLSAIVRHFPDTDAAEDASKRLEALPGAGEIPIDRETLAAHPGLLGPGALDIDPTLLDGDERNGELGPKGVFLTPRGVRLVLVDDGDTGERQEARPLAPEQLARARAAVEEALYARLVTRDDRDPETGRYEHWIPVYVRGSLGEDGVSVTPALKLRRYRTDEPALYQ